MEDHLNKNVVLVGPGGIARDYAKVLLALGTNSLAVGRTPEKCEKFQHETGLACLSAGIESHLRGIDVPNTYFIVSVNTENLGDMMRTLLRAGAQHILVEKPAGIHKEDIALTIDLLKNSHVTPFVAYNRRFYASFQKAKQIIEEQGGLVSFSFEFTEWTHEAGSWQKTPEALEHWLLGNSSHVIDAAFFIGGAPAEMSSYTSGSISWHAAAEQFAGAGISNKGIVFSYQANWGSAGRWGVEFNTHAGKLILRPLEKLAFQKRGELSVSEVAIDNKPDLDFKPGLYRQVKAFLMGDHTNMITLQQHYYNLVNYYDKIKSPRG